MIRFFQLPLLVRLSASLRLIELRPPAFVCFFPAAAHECSAPPPGRASFNFFFWRPAGAPARRAERYAGGLAIGTVVGAGSLTASRSDETRLFVSVMLRVASSFRDTGADSGGRRSSLGVLGSQSAESLSPRDASRRVVLLAPRGVHSPVAFLSAREWSRNHGNRELRNVSS